MVDQRIINVDQQPDGQSIPVVRRKVDLVDDAVLDAPIRHVKMRLAIKTILALVGNGMFWFTVFASEWMNRLTGSEMRSIVMMLIGAVVIGLSSVIRPHPIRDAIDDISSPMRRKLTRRTRTTGKRVVDGITVICGCVLLTSIIANSAESATTWYFNIALAVYYAWIVVAIVIKRLVFNDRVDNSDEMTGRRSTQ